MALQVPPEHMWPTGDTPRELAAVAAVEMPPAYRPPPRPVAADLEAERAAFEAANPALVTEARPVFVPEPPLANGAGAAMTYQLPLGRGKRAVVQLYGEVGHKEISLLVSYLRMTAKSLGSNGDGPADQGSGQAVAVRDGADGGGAAARHHSPVILSRRQRRQGLTG